MYVSGEGSGKERQEAREREAAEKAAREGREVVPAGACGKKHTIKERRVAVGDFAVQQVKDTIFAGAAGIAVAAYMAFTGAAAATVGMSVLPAVLAGFVGKKLINVACRFGKKHVVKKRTKGNGKIKKGVLLTGAGVLSVCFLGLPITSLLAVGVAAATMSKKFRKCKDFDKQVSTKNRKVKRITSSPGESEPDEALEGPELVDEAPAEEVTEEEVTEERGMHR